MKETSGERTREYVRGVSSSGRPTLTLNRDEDSEDHIPFNVWRDVGRLAGKSTSYGINNLTFEFLVPENLPKAVEILKGALFTERDSTSGNYLTLIRQSYVHLQIAYDCAQKGVSGQKEALLLVEAAEKKLQVAKQSLLESIQKGGVL